MATKLAPTVQDVLDEKDRENAIINVIARAASDPNTDVDKLERLLAMQERVLEREAKRAYDNAMRAAQEEIRPILKNRENKETHSTYADLEQISDMADPIIHKHGFSLSYGTADCPKDDHYRVTCEVSHTGGFSKDHQADVPIDNTGPKGSKNKTDTHGFGSALSYGRRYLKVLIFDIKMTDDDGRAAGNGGPINEEQVAVLNGLADAVGADKRKLCNYLKIDALPQLAALKYNDTVHLLEQKNPKAARDFLTGGQ
jgi:hypothetical protein